MATDVTIRGVTGTSRTSDVRAKRPDHVEEWPFVALHFAPVTTSRGERVQRARNLRRMSQKDLAEATGVGERTIVRIESGRAEGSPSLAVLEEFLRIVTPTAVAPAGNDEPRPSPIAEALMRADDLELLAELARRMAARRAQEGDTPPLPAGQYTLYTRDMPSSQRAQEPHHQEEDRGANGL
jgi:transcriptional regulator with XRE-family HTH domain